MSIDNEQDLKGMREAGRVVHEVLEAMRAVVRLGVSTSQVDDVARATLARLGARHAPRHAFGFPGDSCISVNDEAVHGIPGERVVAAGDVVKLDVVAEKNGYMADAAITVNVPPVADESRRLLACAQAAFLRAMSVARAGNRVSDVGRAIDAEVRRWGFSVLRELAGHGIGRLIHEPPSIPNYATPGARRLTDGLVIAIEPIVSARRTRVVEDSDGWTLRTADGSISVHHEHTLIVTRGEPVLLTA